MNKDVRKLIQSISQIDGVEVRTGGKHLTVFKDDKFVTTISATPSDRRWRENTVADLRRAGITPTVRPATVMKTTAIPDTEQLRKRLNEIGPMGPFARYLVNEVGPVTGLRSYKNSLSAESALHQFRTGKTGGLTDWAAVLVDQGLRMRAKVNGQRERAAKGIVADVRGVEDGQGILVTATMKPEPPPENPAAAGVTLHVDVEKLTAALAGFGITLKVE